MLINKNDRFYGFLIGVLSSITAVIVWDLYKKKNGILEYSEQKMMEEIKSSIKNLQDDIELKN